MRRARPAPLRRVPMRIAALPRRYPGARRLGKAPRVTMASMDVLGGTRIRREAKPATVNLRRCKLVVTKGAQRGTEFVIGGDVIRVGKAGENDLVIADET